MTIFAWYRRRWIRELVVPVGFVLASLFPVFAAFDRGFYAGLAMLLGQLLVTGIATVTIFRLLRRRFRRKWMPSPEFPPDYAGVMVVEGRVVEIDEMLESPFTMRPCIAWCIVEPGAEDWEAQWRVRPFVLEDIAGRGKIVIEPEPSRLSSDLPELANGTFLEDLSSEDRRRIMAACCLAENEARGYTVTPPPTSACLDYQPVYELVVAAGDIVVVRGSFVEQEPRGNLAARRFQLHNGSFEPGPSRKLLALHGYHWFSMWSISLVTASLGVLPVSMLVSFSL